MKREKILSTIFYISTLIITIALFVLFTLNLFKIVNFKLNVSYYALFATLVISTVINLLLIILEKKHKINISAFIKGIIFLSVLAFVCVYPAFNLYKSYIFVAVYNVLSCFIFSIIGVSIFFNLTKTKDNIVKVKPKFVILFSLCFVITSQFFIECVKLLIDFLMNKSFDIQLFLINFGMVLVLSLLYNLVIYISLRKNKRFVNYCIIEKL